MLGPGDFAKIHPSKGAGIGYSKTLRVAYLPTHLLYPLEKRRHGVQGDAGVAAAFLIEIDIGCLHAGDCAV